jgi:hypothetical protein
MNRRLFETLAARASGETPPSVDVSGSVLKILASRQGRPVFVSDRPLMWMAAASIIAAIPTAVLAYVMYNSWTGPLVELAESISWVTQ